MSAKLKWGPDIICATNNQFSGFGCVYIHSAAHRSAVCRPTYVYYVGHISESDRTDILGGREAHLPHATRGVRLPALHIRATIQNVAMICIMGIKCKIPQQLVLLSYVIVSRIKVNALHYT